jgi:hypothetical protein
MKKEVYLITLILFIAPAILLGKGYEKKYMQCSGIVKIGEEYFDNHKESVLLQINRNSPKSVLDGDKNFGFLKFSKSYVPWSYNSSIRLCNEDGLKYQFEPICLHDKEPWPKNTSNIDRNCTLDKVTGRFFCRLEISHKDNSPPKIYMWDYKCEITKPLFK